MSAPTRPAVGSAADPGTAPASSSTPQPTPAPADTAPEDLARAAATAVLELHVATSQLLPVASLPEVTQAVQTLMVLVRDITQDMHTVATNYRLDAGHLPHEHFDLRRQAAVTGADAARKYAHAVELLHEASTWLNQTQHDARLMADLTANNAPSVTDTAPPPTGRPDRAKPRSNDHAQRPDVEQGGPAL